MLFHFIERVSSRRHLTDRSRQARGEWEGCGHNYYLSTIMDAETSSADSERRTPSQRYLVSGVLVKRTVDLRSIIMPNRRGMRLLLG